MIVFSVLSIAIFALGIIIAIFGAILLFMHLPSFMQAKHGSKWALHHFRYVEYVNWMKSEDRIDKYGSMLFAAGLASSLLAFPFILIFKSLI